MERGLTDMGIDLIINISEMALLIGIMGFVVKVSYESGKLKQEIKDIKEIVFNWLKPKT